MPLDFCAIDFETANSAPESACQVGLARVRDGELVETASWYIRPPEPFHEFFEFNSTIHGICSEDVAESDGWDELFPRMADFIGDDVLIAHSAGFDMGVLRRSCAHAGCTCPAWRYGCSLQLSRRTYDLPSYRLPASAQAAGFTDFDHHDAGADAQASAHIVIDSARRAGATSVDALFRSHGLSLGTIGA